MGLMLFLSKRSPSIGRTVVRWFSTRKASVLATGVSDWVRVGSHEGHMSFKKPPLGLNNARKARFPRRFTMGSLLGFQVSTDAIIVKNVGKGGEGAPRKGINPPGDMQDPVEAFAILSEEEDSTGSWNGDHPKCEHKADPGNKLCDQTCSIDGPQDKFKQRTEETRQLQYGLVNPLGTGDNNAEEKANSGKAAEATQSFELAINVRARNWKI